MYKKIKVNKNIFYILIIIIIFIIVFYFFILKTNTKLSTNQNQFIKKEFQIEKNNVINIIEERGKWSVRIEKVGADKAYSELKQEFMAKKKDEQHSVAHLFGEILYEKTKNTDGITICDANFGFACFHGFFITILGNKGVGILSELDKACVKKFGPMSSGCQHGLGHGLIEYYGHNLKGLTMALLECGKTTVFANKFGCTSGAFMEFNMPNSLVNVERKKLDSANPYFPCTNMPSQFQESCYFELGQLWLQTFNINYETIGNFCLKIKNKINQESCYLGLGNHLTPIINYGIIDTINACKEMPTEDGKLLCLSGATWAMFSNPRIRPMAKDICKTLEVDLFDQCLKKADLIENNGKIFENI